MRRTILVGVGGRSVMWRNAAAFRYPQSSTLVGLCDINPGRLDLALRQLRSKGVATPLGLRADHRAGAWSILTGIAANHSIAEKRIVSVGELVPDLDLPDYPPTPDWDLPIGLPVDGSPARG